MRKKRLFRGAAAAVAVVLTFGMATSTAHADFDGDLIEPLEDGLNGISSWNAPGASCGTANVVPLLIANYTGVDQTGSFTVDGDTAEQVVLTSYDPTASNVTCPSRNGTGEWQQNGVSQSQNFTVPAGGISAWTLTLGGSSENLIGTNHEFSIGGLPNGAANASWYDFYLSLNLDLSFNNLDMSYNNTGGTNPQLSTQNGFNVLTCSPSTPASGDSVRVVGPSLTPYTTTVSSPISYGWGDALCLGWLPEGVNISDGINATAANGDALSNSPMTAIYNSGTQTIDFFWEGATWNDPADVQILGANGEWVSISSSNQSGQPYWQTGIEGGPGSNTNIAARNDMVVNNIPAYNTTSIRIVNPNGDTSEAINISMFVGPSAPATPQLLTAANGTWYVDSLGGATQGATINSQDDEQINMTLDITPGYEEDWQADNNAWITKIGDTTLVDPVQLTVGMIPSQATGVFSKNALGNIAQPDGSGLTANVTYTVGIGSSTNPDNLFTGSFALSTIQPAVAPAAAVQSTSASTAKLIPLPQYKVTALSVSNPAVSAHITYGGSNSVSAAMTVDVTGFPDYTPAPTDTVSDPSVDPSVPVGLDDPFAEIIPSENETPPAATGGWYLISSQVGSLTSDYSTIVTGPSGGDMSKTINIPLHDLYNVATGTPKTGSIDCTLTFAYGSSLSEADSGSEFINVTFTITAG